jgi:hypothetical protein
LTDADGFFEVEFNAQADPRLPGAFGYIHASRIGYHGDVQMLPIGATPNTKNLRMSLIRRIDAGRSITVSLRPDSALCWPNPEELPDWARRCEVIDVTSGTAGTLVVEAHGTASAVPLIYFPDNYSSLPVSTVPGTVSVQVSAGTTSVLIGVPSGTVETFEVSTSLR